MSVSTSYTDKIYVKLSGKYTTQCQ